MDWTKEPLLGQHVSYGDWNSAYNELAEIYSIDYAQERFDTKLNLDVILGEDPNQPTGYISIPDGRPWFKVVLLDDRCRRHYSQLYVPGVNYSRPDALFLEQIGIDHYPDTPRTDHIVYGGELSEWGETYYLDPDGSVHGYRSPASGSMEKMYTKMTQNEVELLLWEPWPKFGHWDSLIRINRDMNLTRLDLQ